MSDFEIIKNEELKQLPKRLKDFGVQAQNEIDQIYVEEGKQRIESVGAVNSGNYVSHYTVREAYMEGVSRVVEINSPEAETYSDIVETGKAGEQVMYRGRYPIAQSLDTADPRIDSVLDRMGEEI
jgi:hypothetical protein